MPPYLLTPVWHGDPTSQADQIVSVSLADDLKALKVSISQQPPVQAVLAGNILIPCSITYLRPLPTSSTAGRRAVLGTPRVKWTFISDGREVEILVARGNRVKVSEDYRFRASLPTFQHQRTNASLLLRELRPSDSGIYRCDVQHGIDDGHDLLEVKVKGNGASLWGCHVGHGRGCRAGSCSEKSNKDRVKKGYLHPLAAREVGNSKQQL